MLPFGILQQGKIFERDKKNAKFFLAKQVGDDKGNSDVTAPWFWNSCYRLWTEVQAFIYTPATNFFKKGVHTEYSFYSQ